MPGQDERPDEAAAADVVRVQCGDDLSSLTFSGGAGGIDYTGLGVRGRVILEVTRLSESHVRKDWDAARAHLEAPTPILTARSWWVTFEGHPRYSGIADRLAPALRALERHHLSDYYGPAMDWWLRHVPTLAEVLHVLSAERVIAARTIELKDLEAPSELFISPSGSWVFGGVDTALEQLEDYLKRERRHVAKTVAEPAQERHLFLWADATTPPEFANALTDDRFCNDLPSRPPDIPTELHHLWVVHTETLRGWHWQGAARGSGEAPTGWSRVLATPSPVSSDHR